MRKLYSLTLPFHAWVEFVEREALARYGPGGAPGLVSGFGSGRFTLGVGSFEKALELVQHGWPEGTAKAKAFSDLTVEKIASHLATEYSIVQDVTGAAYDVGSLVSGVPECWYAPIQTDSKPCVSIGVDSFMSASVNHNAAVLRGSATVALVLALQRAGYAVEVSVMAGSDSTEERDKTFWARVSLEDANGGPLDIDRLAAMIGHPASPRWLLYNYASIVGEQDPQKARFECYSCHVSIPCPWTFDVFVPRLVQGDADFNSEASTLAWVKARFEEITRKGGK